MTPHRLRTVLALVAGLTATLAVVSGAGGASAGPAGLWPPARSCESLATLALPHTTIDSATTVAGGTVGTMTGLPVFCDVLLTVTNPPAGDQIKVEVWLPTATWNGRFQGTGGAGYAGGAFAAALAPAIRAGYAAASTDTGHAGGSGSFALNPDATLNWQLIADNAYLGIHEMTVAAQAVVTAYYGHTSLFNYFNGCSTGGRQGLMEAQRYPTEYDGIAAAAPAINWTKLHPAQLWGQLKMLAAADFLPPCKLTAITDAATRACDRLDGVTDGVISDWQGCRFDARAVIGSVTACGTITATDAAVVNDIWQGPRGTDGNFLWYGPVRGTDLGALNGTATAPDGSITGVPFFITLHWFQYWLKQDPGWDWHTITDDQYLRLFQQSVVEFGYAIATDDPNLTAFRDAGGKVVLWHGLADQLVFPQGTVDYYQRLRQSLGGDRATDRFARLFLAPGVQHCGGGPGSGPVDPLAALVDWVENHHAPDSLPGHRVDPRGNVVQTRPLCAYPMVARYRGHGRTDDAASFVCARTFG